MRENRVRSICLGAAALVLMVSVAPAASAEPGVSALNPNRPAPDGFLAPTLEGDWRVRIAADAWLPSPLVIEASSPAGGGSVRKDLVWLLRALYFYFPFDFEVRKGRFGVLYHTFMVGLRPNDPVDVIGPITLDWNVWLLMFDAGITYELGRWHLWDAPNAPELMLEPYFEARIIYLPIDITVGVEF